MADISDLVSWLQAESTAFIRELLRKAALLPAEEIHAAQNAVHARRLDEVYSELVVAGGTLTQTLLGAKTNHDGE